MSINGNTTRDKVLRWTDLPILGPINNARFLPFNKTRLYIDNNNPSLEEPEKLSVAKEDANQKKRLAKENENENEKGQSFGQRSEY